ncbi:hypothetical protein [Nodularia chucula]
MTFYFLRKNSDTTNVIYENSDVNAIACAMAKYSLDPQKQILTARIS